MEQKDAKIGRIALLLFPLILLMVMGIQKQVANVNAAGQKTVPTTLELPTVYLPLALNNHDPMLPTPLFGVQMYGNSTATSYYPSLVDSGATWIRIRVRWIWAEPVNVSPDEYEWSAIDNALSAAQSEKGAFNIIATVDRPPIWAAASERSPIYPDQLDDFAEFVGALVERYDGDGVDDAPGSPVVVYWEFFNEPDANIDDGRPEMWGARPDLYAQMLAAAYPAVKAANPQAKVALGGLAYDWFEDQGGTFVRDFLDDVLIAGGGQHFDVMNFHTYPAFGANWAAHGPGLYEKAQFIRNKLLEYGLEKPLIVTEAGWHSNNPPNLPSSPEIQARYVAELFTQGIVADLDVMIWWMLYDPGGFGLSNGLITRETQPIRKPAFTAYQTAIGKLSTAHLDRILTDAETGDEMMEAYRFEDRVHDHILYVVWLDPVDTSETRPFSLTATTATVSNIYGTSTVVSDGDDGVIDGKITIQVGGQPAYVEIDR